MCEKLDNFLIMKANKLMMVSIKAKYLSSLLSFLMFFNLA